MTTIDIYLLFVPEYHGSLWKSIIELLFESSTGRCLFTQVGLICIKNSRGLGGPLTFFLTVIVSCFSHSMTGSCMFTTQLVKISQWKSLKIYILILNIEKIFILWFTLLCILCLVYKSCFRKYFNINKIKYYIGAQHVCKSKMNALYLDIFYNELRKRMSSM